MSVDHPFEALSAGFARVRLSAAAAQSHSESARSVIHWTISKDNTAGECARRADLLAHLGRKIKGPRDEGFRREVLGASTTQQEGVQTTRDELMLATRRLEVTRAHLQSLLSKKLVAEQKLNLPASRQCYPDTLRVFRRFDHQQRQVQEEVDEQEREVAQLQALCTEKGIPWELSTHRSGNFSASQKASIAPQGQQKQRHERDPLSVDRMTFLPTPQIIQKGPIHVQEWQAEMKSRYTRDVQELRTTAAELIKMDIDASKRKYDGNPFSSEEQKQFANRQAALQKAYGEACQWIQNFRESQEVLKNVGNNKMDPIKGLESQEYDRLRHGFDLPLQQQQRLEAQSQEVDNPFMPNQVLYQSAASQAEPIKQKPWLSINEIVKRLEREFERNPKPSSGWKREFADQMGVQDIEIMNWFQNRRAKAKQLKRQQGYEAKLRQPWQDLYPSYSGGRLQRYLNA